VSRLAPAVRTWPDVAEMPNLVAERSTLERLSRIEGIGGIQTSPDL
jgi:hypothetical protein